MTTRKKGERGRFVSERPETNPDKVTTEPGAPGVGTMETETKGVRRVAAPRPKFCRTYAKARFAEALPEISEALLKEAKEGSVAHLKLLMQLTGLDKDDVVPRKMKPRGRSLEAFLMDEWRKDEEAMARRAEAQAAEVE